jgi:hypothetical protein
MGGISGGGSSQQNIALGKQMAAKYGWTGGQFQDLVTLWTNESGWRTTADNPTSSAYGIPQALPGSKMASAGPNWRTDPKTQIAWGLGYIKDRYGSPSKALSFWNAQDPHWYESGEWNVRNNQDARVHKGEMILPTKVAQAVRGELTAPGIKGTRREDASVVFAPGSIVVQLTGPVSSTQAKESGRRIVDAMMDDARMKMLVGSAP